MTVGSQAVAGEKLKIDPQHSSVGFSVRHLFSRVHGQCGEFSGTIEYDVDSIDKSKLQVTIQASSVDTNVKNRDDDLRSDRFFDVETFPTLEFFSKKIRKLDGNKFQIFGKLTMHGITRTVVLEAEFLGSGKDPWGNQRFGFHASTTVNRKDFEMEWNETLETGGLLVGEEIEIVLDIEAILDK
jgi:polyisoprenoid-binding protein YceI